MLDSRKYFDEEGLLIIRAIVDDSDPESAMIESSMSIVTGYETELALFDTKGEFRWNRLMRAEEDSNDDYINRFRVPRFSKDVCKGDVIARGLFVKDG